MNLRSLFHSCTDVVKFYTSSHQIPQRAASCIMYHNLHQGSTPVVQWRTHHVNALRHQIRAIKKKFTILPLDQWFEEKNKTRSPIVAITFDDGLANNLLAIPVLEEQDAHATFFVCTASLAGERFLWPDALDVACYLSPDVITIGDTRFERHGGIHMTKSGIRPAHAIKQLPAATRWEMILSLTNGVRVWEQEPWQAHFAVMNEAQVKELSDSPYAAIGSHGIAHQNLEFMSDEEIFLEMQQSKNCLESWTGKQISAYAFADGSYKHNTHELAMACGYRFVCAVVPRFNEHPGIALTGRYGFYSDRHWTGQLLHWTQYLRKHPTAF